MEPAVEEVEGLCGMAVMPDEHQVVDKNEHNQIDPLHGLLGMVGHFVQLGVLRDLDPHGAVQGDSGPVAG